MVLFADITKPFAKIIALFDNYVWQFYIKQQMCAVWCFTSYDTTQVTYWNKLNDLYNMCGSVCCQILIVPSLSDHRTICYENIGVIRILCISISSYDKNTQQTCFLSQLTCKNMQKHAKCLLFLFQVGTMCLSRIQCFQ